MHSRYSGQRLAEHATFSGPGRIRPPPPMLVGQQKSARPARNARRTEGRKPTWTRAFPQSPAVASSERRYRHPGGTHLRRADFGRAEATRIDQIVVEATSRLGSEHARDLSNLGIAHG